MTAPPRLPGAQDLSPEHPGELGARFAAHDWSLTPLGPISEWPAALRTSVSICLTSRFPILIWWGADYVMIYNDGYRPMLGQMKHPMALGSPGKDVWPEIWDTIGPMLDSVMDTGRATWSRDQKLIVDRNGYLEEAYFTFSYSPITVDDGRVGGVFTAVTETTDHVLSERRLGTLGVLSRRLGEATDADHVRRLATAVLGSNPQDHPLVAMVDATALPDDPRDLDVPEELRADVLAAATQAATLQHQVHHGLPVPVALPDSGLSVAGLHAMPITLPGDDELSEVLVVGRSSQRRWDPALATYVALCITHLGTALSAIRMLDTQRQRAETLEALDGAKSAFFTNVSHELRTPLTLIAGPVTESLADPGLSPEHRERLELVDRNAARLTRMVDAMLDFGRMAASKIQPVPQPLDVVVQTRAMADSFAQAFDRAGLDFAVECDETEQTAFVDRDMYERIVLNLLSNALKYTPSGAVRLRLECGDEGFVVAVTDTGIGIRRRDLPRVFERFEQLPRRGRARFEGGAGIGLAMVKQLTELMGGSVDVESALGRGSTFTIRLPWGSPVEPSEQPAGRSITPRNAVSFLAEAEGWSEPYAAEPAPSAAGTAAVVGSHAQPVAGASTDRPRLLVAEDNPDMRTYLRGALETDYDLEIVRDGTTALQRAVASRPDIVLTDAMMPGLDGFSLTRAIRMNATLRDVPVIILSARAAESDTAEGLTSGADDYVSKPFSVGELKARLASNLERSRARLRDAAWRRAVMESFQDALLITDAEGDVVEVNDAFTQLLGYAAADGPFPVPHPWWPAAEPLLGEARADGGEAPLTDRENVEDLLGQALRGATITGRECRLVTKDHRDVWVRLSTREVESIGDQPNYVVMTLQDVTREHAARERRQAAAELSAEFGSAEDLEQVLESAVTGFAELFDGDSTVRALAGPEEHVFTTAGPVRRDDLDETLWDVLTAAEPEVPAPNERVTGLLISPQNHPSSECRVWVQFRRPRRVATDERIVGDLLGQAFALAVDRVVAATAFADRESHLSRAIESHRLIGQAIGILIERHRVTPAQAFTMLKKASQDRNIKLREIASRVIETGAEPDQAD